MRRTAGVLAVLLIACSSSKAKPAAAPSIAPSTATTTTAPTTTTEPATTTTTTAPGVAWPAVASDGVARDLLTPNGIVVPVTGDAGNGTYTVTTPCQNSATTPGTPIPGANVVLDPGHGGTETGAVGPTGLEEKDVNLAIAQDVQQQLESLGATVVLTRTGDYNPTLKTRAAIATAVHPQVFLSIHHNAEPDGPSDVPGNEDYYQIKSDSSKRMAGILWEEITAAFTPYHVAWAADTDHGAKYRLGSSGGDYYGILRNAEGTTTVLSEAAFISNPPEEKLLADPAFRHVEATAITKAIVRFVTTADPGSGFVTPYPRTEPAGGGGGIAECDDPTL